MTSRCPLAVQPRCAGLPAAGLDLQAGLLLAALDKGYGYGSLLNDIPRAEVDPITGEIWVPHNLNNTVEYQVNLEYALVWSKNVPSVQLFKLVGAKDVEAWARRLSMTTPIFPDQALALGASCTRIDELTRVFSAFARNGSLEDPVDVRRVRDRAGQVVEDNTAASDPTGPPDARLDRMVALAGRSVKNVIPPRAAWLTSQLLRRVVTKGHAPALRSTGLLVAGKTGTSSATMDTWFVGYTSRWMITTWIGDDRRERPLGFKDAAFMLNVPMAARFLWETTAGQPLRDIPWERPAGVRTNDTGGNLRATMEAVKAEDDAAAHKRKGLARRLWVLPSHPCVLSRLWLIRVAHNQVDLRREPAFRIAPTRNHPLTGTHHQGDIECEKS